MKKTNEVSKLAGISRRTLQYYDDEGLIMAERSQDNHRVYDEKILERIWQILIYKEMGFELKEIKQLTQISDMEKKRYFEQRCEKIRNQMIKLRVQMGVIAFIQNQGMPSRPLFCDGGTYKSQISELRNKIKEEFGFSESREPYKQ